MYFDTKIKLELENEIGQSDFWVTYTLQVSIG